MVKWVNLESVIQSKGSQKEKQILYVKADMESRKMVQVTLFAGQEWRCRYRELKWGCREGEGKVGQTVRGVHIHIDTHTQTHTHRHTHTHTAATIAAKSLQSCPTLCDPRDSSPPGSLVPGILQARTLEWVAISFSNA